MLSMPGFFGFDEETGGRFARGKPPSFEVAVLDFHRLAFLRQAAEALQQQARQSHEVARLLKKSGRAQGVTH